ncbi:uncharacterized protein C16orf86 homolog [Mauremys reevesii]|uniref:uncharacterized protein C16orf86 homolog n=1 Tax=Mauremys reevesii TaxID=260615 RepID=UPI00193F7DD6|nr:uncharacterized protein C16orf86 homolog [Mauremys reevesii]
MATAARSPSEKRPGGKAMPGRFISQLAAALDNPTIKALEWDEDGQGVVVNPKLYDEEAQKHKELFPELKALRSVSVLQAWLLTSGFKAKAAKADSAVHVFQHADFRKLPPKAGEVDSPLATRQHKKAKKRKSSSDLAASPAAALPPDTLRTDRRPQRLRPLYQYINYDNPELNSPSEEESDTPETAALEEAAGAPDKANMEEAERSHQAGTKSDNAESCSPGTPPQAEVDKSTQVDIDKMLSVCAAHLVPPLSPQYK